ncbi:OmpA family protein [Vulgatibacter incomptus]|uniref:OmpA family protein n=1 Tax=Vulgatibacter incomptus TaxID=1391653 RepID=UPI001969FAA6|nr:OmpA family protein [Vulgatibacter incomptus]
MNGLCEECGADSDCKAGFKCEVQTGGGNRCVPAAECYSNRDCSGGKVCQSGSCVACASDDACGPNMMCNNGACQPKAECSVDDDCRAGSNCIEGRCVAVGPICPQDPIRFAFNEYSLSTQARTSLNGLADCLRQKAGNAAVTLEGHCDERGTEEYNMTLGEKRAVAVKKYLSNLGIDNGRLRTVSYGKERPAAYGSNEDAWAANRRVEFTVAR